MRIGNYEMAPSNQWCYQLYKVMDEGFDNRKSRYKTASDGRALKPLDCYPNDLGAAIRRAIEFNERDHVALGTDESEMLDAIIAMHEQVMELTKEVE